MKSDPASDDRVDGALDGSTPLFYSLHPRQMPEPSASSGGPSWPPPWRGFRGMLEAGSDKKDRDDPSTAGAGRAWAAWCSSRFFFPGSLSQGSAEPLTDWLSNHEIESCGCDSFEASKRSAVFPAIENE